MNNGRTSPPNSTDLTIDQIVWRAALAEHDTISRIAVDHGVHVILLVTERHRQGMSAEQIVEFVRGLRYLASIDTEVLTEFVSWVIQTALAAQVYLEQQVAAGYTDAASTSTASLLASAQNAHQTLRAVYDIAGRAKD
jgi:hypothetical protein